MSSNEEEHDDNELGCDVLPKGTKKRRIQRACDMCRRKKIRCDGAQMDDNRCSNCITYDLACTYVEAAKKRGPPKGYVESLENRVHKLENLLHRICPNKDLLKELKASFDSLGPLESSSSAISSQTNIPPNAFLGDPADVPVAVLRKSSEPTPKVEPEDTVRLTLLDEFGEEFKRITIDPTEYRFFGKSSGVMLIQTAVDLKNEYTGKEPDLKRAVLCPRRPEYWAANPWERSISVRQLSSYTFPPPDLATSLIDLYFQHVNQILPLLHRPTFERHMTEGLHHSNSLFGAVVLLVCAVGSRFSDDPRVKLDGEEGFHSCGWKFFEQVQVVRPRLLAAPCLFELQMHCLAVQYLQGTSAPQACWTLVGIGIRLAQDVGLHRRKVSTKPWTVEDELRKRVFWVLVAIDTQMGCSLGRPCAIQDEDCDVDYPLEVDDEYWEHPDPEQRFKQPPGKPSLVTAFNLYLKLSQLLAFTLRTIYSINKSKILLGFVGQQWEQHIVAELDSALNKWVDSVPDHLRWDPNRENLQFFRQSVVLYTNYYHLQIVIHRPFIPSPRKPSPLSFPSLAICTNAARSCSHIVDVMRKRNVYTAPFCQMAVFTSGIVLLLNIWGGKRSGLSTDPQKEMADVGKCMAVLSYDEQRWHTAGRLWDILYELASVGELPLPQPSPPTSNKRERDEDDIQAAALPATAIAPEVQGPRPIVGSRRVGHVLKQTAPQEQVYDLPVYSEELGRLPLHEGFATHSQFGRNPPQAAVQPDHWWLPSDPQMSHQPSSQYTENRQLNSTWDGGGASSIPYQMAHVPDAMGMPRKSQMPNQYTAAQVSRQYIHSSNTGMAFTAGDEMRGMQGYFESNAASQVPQVPTQPPWLVDNDMITMWLNAPAGLEPADWGAYLSTASELTHVLHRGGH